MGLFEKTEIVDHVCSSHTDSLLFVEVCDCLKAECVFGTDIDDDLILFLYV